MCIRDSCYISTTLLVLFDYIKSFRVLLCLSNFSSSLFPSPFWSLDRHFYWKSAKKPRFFHFSSFLRPFAGRRTSARQPEMILSVYLIRQTSTTTSLSAIYRYSFPESQSFSLCSTLATVSYTHLDVYKRQPQKDSYIFLPKAHRSGLYEYGILPLFHPKSLCSGDFC